MICSSCGSTVAQDARFCPHCGAQTATQPPPPIPAYTGVPLYGYTRVTRHLQIAGILWIVYGIERTLSQIAGMMFLHGLFGSHIHSQWGDWAPIANWSMAAIWPVMLVSAVVGLVLSLLTGYALLTRQPWGRIIAIVTSILALIHPVLGTALGIYTLWMLAPAASGVEYAALTRSTPR